MIDLHAHILPGVDDGAPDVEASVCIAREAVADGIRTLVATPHVSPRYRYDVGSIPRLAGELDALLDARGIPLKVLPGAEIAVSSLADLQKKELQGLSLGDGPALLVESPTEQGASCSRSPFSSSRVTAIAPCWRTRSAARPSGRIPISWGAWLSGVSCAA